MKLNQPKLLSACGVILLIITALFVWRAAIFSDDKIISEADPKVTQSRETLESAGGSISGISDSPSLPPGEADAPKAPSEPAKQKDQILQEIHTLSIQYTAENVPKIAPYLVAGDPDVRAAALDGLINLGESSASVEIRGAMSKLEDPDEKVSYQKAADYLDLPSDTIMRSPKKK